MSVKRLVAIVVAAPLIVLGAAVACAAGVNQCLDCHTTPSRLVPAVREILRGAKGLSGATQSEGEG